MGKSPQVARRSVAMGISLVATVRSMHRAHFEVVADVDRRHWWFVARRKILRDVLRCLMPTDPNAVVIDVGCGAGANIAALAEDYQCVGIDTSSDAIELARSQHPRVHFIVGQAPSDLGDLVNRARAMLLMDVLEHVEDDRGLLASLVWSMPVGGYLLLTVPADMRLWSAHDEGLMHFRRYDPSMLRRLWTGLPVEPIAVSHFCSRLYPLARVGRSLGRLKNRFVSRNNSWRMPVPPAPINHMMQRIFEGESRRLMHVVQGGRSSAYVCGVSLMAILRRVQSKPEESARSGAA